MNRKNSAKLCKTQKTLVKLPKKTGFGRVLVSSFDGFPWWPANAVWRQNAERDLLTQPWLEKELKKKTSHNEMTDTAKHFRTATKDQ